MSTQNPQSDDNGTADSTPPSLIKNVSTESTAPTSGPLSLSMNWGPQRPLPGTDDGPELLFIGSDGQSLETSPTMRLLRTHSPVTARDLLDAVNAEGTDPRTHPGDARS